MKHFCHKLWGTACILANLGLARTFGQYEHSGWNGDISYAQYRWRGKTWIIPTSPVETALGHEVTRLTGGTYDYSISSTHLGTPK